MPHSMSSHEDNDDLVISDLLSGDPTGANKLGDILTRDLEPGEKASDAIDYEDIDDDDLADEEDEQGGPASSPGSSGWENGGKAGADGDLDDFLQDTGLPEAEGPDAVEPEFDDLFGDMPSSSLAQDHPAESGPSDSLAADSIPFDFGGHEAHSPESRPSQGVAPQGPGESAFRNITEMEQIDLMAQNFDMVPAPPENREEALATMWPRFKEGKILNFIDLLPPKRTQYVGKTPLKVPKPVLPTKLSLELAQDQERAFRIPDRAPTNRTMPPELGQRGFIWIPEPDAGSGTSDDEVELESLGDDEDIAGVPWNDLGIICDDWDTKILDDLSSDEAEPIEVRAASPGSDDLFQDIDDEWAREREAPLAKKRKTSHDAKSLPFSVEIPPVMDPERATEKIGKRVLLDLNDPQLLVDVADTEPPAKRIRFDPEGVTHGGSGNLTKNMFSRYNISNDDAYEMLKENHQSKVRSTLGNLTVEHSVPALKLQYPYYKVKLAIKEARSFHRPAMTFVSSQSIKFDKLGSQKKKHLKGKETQAIFQSTSDLSLADNSHCLLLEYSEEYPTMLSNFGMGSRLINYYRRKNMEDSARPRLEIGETAVLMPQDKSPFAAFGSIDPGETVPTLYNGMFRAPIFKQTPQPTDFLVIRNTTGVDGSKWYIRNVDHIYVAGQELPAVEVPGPHSRKVTTASKNRLKMIAYRMIRKNKTSRFSIEDITAHFEDSTDIQNRQKLKEFLSYNKDYRQWELRPGETVPDSAVIRSMVQPEEVCLLESSQVGQRHLQDAGYGKDAEGSDEEEGKEGQSMEQQLAPWHTTKNFLHATQGKAMLQLHGEGDPSGRGEALSFIRTSMKGGYRPEGESAADKMDAKHSKDLGGHTYNVARQQKAYQDAIRRIWDKQKSSLSSTLDQSEVDGDDEVGNGPEDVLEDGRTPRSEPFTPAASTHRGDDETGTQFSKLSRFSNASQSGKVLKIMRTTKHRGVVKKEEEVITDARVIRQYLKRRHAIEADAMALYELNPTGDAEKDKRAQKRIQEELARLERNKDRRIARDKQKGIFTEGAAASPDSPGSPSASQGKMAGTQRKCANCGRVGHIKTNKKLCPQLNGTAVQEESVSDAGFGAADTPPPAAS